MSQALLSMPKGGDCEAEKWYDDKGCSSNSVYLRGHLPLRVALASTLQSAAKLNAGLTVCYHRKNASPIISYMSVYLKIKDSPPPIN